MPPPPPPPEPSLVDDLLDNPLIPGVALAALATLLGFGLYRAQQRKKSTQVDSSFLESRLQPDSFFGASGGQRIDTNEGATGSSMVYSPSQLDAAGDVDPVAEADVYLAYGRDLQAEEILKEAMRTQPQRVAIHSKLLEIYAKRRDARAFEMVATEAHKLTGGEGPEWGHICELGQELDGSNALYRPGGQPSDSAVATATGAAMGTFGATTVTQAYSESEAPSSTDLDLDLDLDFSAADDEPAAASSGNALPDTTQALNAQAGAEPEPVPALDMDFDLPAGMLDLPVQDHGAVQPTATDTPELKVDEDALSFDLDLPADAAAPTVAAEPVPPAPEAGMIEFDLGSLSLDLPGAEPEAPHASASLPDLDDLDDVDSTAGAPLSTAGFDDTGGDDPLATKLALAQEFNAIGDPDGARSLAQEVVAEASGDLKTAAQKFLADIS
jgi:pilus assembly protein FimV